MDRRCRPCRRCRTLRTFQEHASLVWSCVVDSRSWSSAHSMAQRKSPTRLPSNKRPTNNASDDAPSLSFFQKQKQNKNNKNRETQKRQKRRGLYSVVPPFSPPPLLLVQYKQKKKKAPRIKWWTKSKRNGERCCKDHWLIQICEQEGWSSNRMISPLHLILGLSQRSPSSNISLHSSFSSSCYKYYKYTNF